LQRVADSFADSPAQFERNTEHLTSLALFTERLADRERARTYLALAEPSALDQIESARRELQQVSDSVHTLFDPASVARFDLLWKEFRALYVEHYAALHDQVMNSAGSRRAVDSLLRDDRWRDFESLSQLSLVNRQYWDDATRLLTRARALRCDLPVRQILEGRPVCGCSFRLARAAHLANVAQALEETMQAGRAAHRRTLALWAQPLAHALESLAQTGDDEETRRHAAGLAAGFEQGEPPSPLSAADVHLIEAALAETSMPHLRLPLPVDGHALLTGDELGARVRQWLDDLPTFPAFVEIVSGGGSHAL
jgi:hypothetical protein